MKGGKNQNVRSWLWASRAKIERRFMEFLAVTSLEPGFYIRTIMKTFTECKNTERKYFPCLFVYKILNVNERNTKISFKICYIKYGRLTFIFINKKILKSRIIETFLFF